MPARVVLGIVLLVLVSLFSVIKLTNPTEKFAARFFGIIEVVPDVVTLSDLRFFALRPLLPQHGTVGYLTDRNMQGLEMLDEWLAVKYALAPLFVEKGPTAGIVVGDIRLPTTEVPKVLHDSNLVLLKDLGNGVLLLRRRAP